MTQHSATPLCVALFDVCSTLLSVETIKDFTEQVVLSPRHNKRLSFATRIRHSLFTFGIRNKIIPKHKYNAHAAQLLKGYPESQVRILAQTYANMRFAHALHAPVVEKLREYAKRGYKVYLVSAGFDIYLTLLAQTLGTELISTTLEKDGEGMYTGAIAGTECKGEAKVEKLKAALGNAYTNVNWHDSVAFGDSMSDIPLLSLVGNAWVINPRKNLAEYATQHGWHILKTS